MSDLVRSRIILFAKIGLVFGVVYAFGGFFIDLFVTLGWVMSTETPGLSYGTLLAFFALIGMPLIFGAFGAVVGFVEDFLR